MADDDGCKGKNDRADHTLSNAHIFIILDPLIKKLCLKTLKFCIFLIFYFFFVGTGPRVCKNDRVKN